MMLWRNDSFFNVALREEVKESVVCLYRTVCIIFYFFFTKKDKFKVNFMLNLNETENLLFSIYCAFELTWSIFML